MGVVGYRYHNPTSSGVLVKILDRKQREIDNYFELEDDGRCRE